MARTARTKRNLEKSLKAYIESSLSDGGFTGFSIELSYKKANMISLPVVQCNVLDSSHTKAEVGTNSTWRKTLMIVRIFTEYESLTLDVSDYLVSKLKLGFPYYIYTKSSGTETSTQDGRVSAEIEEDRPIDYDTEKSELDEHDQHRYEIVISVDRGKVES